MNKMLPSTWPDWLDSILAKSSPRETLAGHTWNVLDQLARRIQLRPGLPGSIGLPGLWAILFWGGFLHDFGKAAGGFQEQLLGEVKSWKFRHEIISLAFLDWIKTGFSPEDLRLIAAAIASHHREPGYLDDHFYRHRPVEPGDRDPLQPRLAELSDTVLQGLWLWLSTCQADWIQALGFDRAGVTPVALPPLEEAIGCIRDPQRVYTRVGDYLRFARQLKRQGDGKLAAQTLYLRGYLVNADYSASAHAAEWPQIRLNPAVIMDGLKPHHHQKTARRREGSALLVAPTGSGKTKAALLWVHRQVASLGETPRIFYVLPYQASMNAMRLEMGQIFGEDKVSLEHSRATMALYRLWVENDDNAGNAAQRAKWARQLAQLNHLPVRILTPYQLLKAAFKLKGYEMLLSDCHKGLFIFDEIHAYEVERLAMILRTIAYLRQQHQARFMVMSATFPSLIERWVREALDIDSNAVIRAAPALFANYQRHRLHLSRGDLLERLDKVEADARQGKSVLVVCNTIGRTQQAWERLSKTLMGICRVELLHGGFNARDRLGKEQLVRTTAGKTGRQPIVLVATQVVEVSLDISLDTIYTDPGPLEALIQRFGRVNRWREQAGLADVYVFEKPDDGQGIYNENLVKNSLTLLRDLTGDGSNSLAVDESQVGEWLNRVYQGEIAETWEREYQNTGWLFEQTQTTRLWAFDTAGRLEENEFYKMFDGVDVLPASLLSEYESLKDTNPLQAAELLVSIRWKKLLSLKKGGLVQDYQDGIYMVNAVYTRECGLQFVANEGGPEVE